MFLVTAFFAFTPAKKLVQLSQYAGPAIAIAMGVVLTLAGRGIVGLPMLGIGLAWLQHTRSRLK